VSRLWLTVAVKVALIGLLLVGAFSGLQQFEGKAMGGLTGSVVAALLTAGLLQPRRLVGRTTR
jgi:hypothetical protein